MESSKYTLYMLELFGKQKEAKKSMPVHSLQHVIHLEYASILSSSNISIHRSRGFQQFVRIPPYVVHHPTYLSLYLARGHSQTHGENDLSNPFLYIYTWLRKKKGTHTYMYN